VLVAYEETARCNPGTLKAFAHKGTRKDNTVKKNEEIRDRIVKVLKKAKEPLSRAEIEDRLKLAADERLPLPQMVNEGSIIVTGKTRAARYSLPAATAA
jgi:hypothetical protein